VRISREAMSALALFGALASVAAPTGAQQSKTRFEITFPAGAHAAPVTGRVYVMISRTASPEPRLAIGRTGGPFYGRDVEKLAPGAIAIIDASDLGSPVESLSDVPAGDYYVQGFVNIYSEFRRSDGHVLWMHDDQWEGQQFNRSPGNLYSETQKVHLDPAHGYTIRLNVDKVIPPIVVPPDDQWVQRIKIQSAILTKFWGRPIYLGATVLLPKDYATSNISYPVNYIQDHFNIASPLPLQATAPDPSLTNGAAVAAKRANDFYKEWNKDDFPRVIVVRWQHPNPYFDDSYAVNSPNVGPYADAIQQELIPELEKRYRIIKEPWARWLSGGSTGGWESLAQMVLYPDVFGSTWSYCPDPVTFSDVEGVDFYHDTNAYYKQFDWRREPTINSREINGQVRQTSQHRNYFELVSGTHGRSGQQIDIWSAVWGPVGADGYFAPAFDKRTGEIHPEVVAYWKEHWDLVEYLKRNWTTVGPKLVDRIHIYTGDADTYYLNNAAVELQEFLKTTQNPHYEGSFVYGWRKPHCYTGPLDNADKLREMASWGLAHKPDHDAGLWWRH
jgi:hypothetical protein